MSVASEDGFALEVSIVHGDLREAHYPVVVGHYEGDVIVNAEAALDRGLNGRLRQRFDLGGYPGPEGTVEVIRRPKGSYPPGGIVVGLGKVGSLTPERLRQAIKTAVSRLALEVSEDPREDLTYRKAAFSSVLVGTDGGTSTGLTDSILSIVRGALDANRLIRQHNLWDEVRVAAIEFIELYEDMAIQAARVLAGLEARMVDECEPNERVRCAKFVLSLPSGRSASPRPANQYTEGWWRRLSVRRKASTASDASADLQFTVVSDRARIEQDTQTTQRALVDQLVAGATTQTNTPLELSQALYELLVPVTVQDRIRHGGNLVLMLDRAGAAYPFELLAQRTRQGPMPLAVDRCLIRQIETEHYRENPRMAVGEDILVIGDPSSLWAELPGAQEEAKTVAAHMSANGFTATLSLREGPQEIITKLFAREYRVLHIAAHGHYDPNPMKSGVVIGDRAFLTAAEVASLPAVPELVFLNCCHLGVMASDARPSGTDPRLAATIAEGFIRAGVRAIIVAGWAVDDEAALVFANTFYSSLLLRASFGEAVKDARKATFELPRKTNTWGAYQCYGNPDFRLRREAPRTESRSWSPVSRNEMMQVLRDISADARREVPEMRSELTSALSKLKTSSPKGWRDGELLAQQAMVASELGAFAEAIALYKEAIASRKTRAPISAVEQLANILSRHATSLFLEDRAAGAGPAREFLSDAKDWLDWLDGRLVPTPERQALRGSLHKRWAMITTGEERKEHLEKACEAYRAAAEQPDAEMYVRLTLLALEGLLDKTAFPRLLVQAQKCLQDAGQPVTGERDFWTAVARADALLHVHWFDGMLNGPGGLRPVEAAYQDARAAGPSVRELRSVRDHIVFLAEVLRDGAQASGDSLVVNLDAIALLLAD